MHQKIFRTALLLASICLFALARTPASAQPHSGVSIVAPVLAASSGIVHVKRKILALYDGARVKRTSLTRIHKLAEMPLNHLGYDVRFHDAAKGLPEPDQLTQYRGVITWFEAPLKNAEAYLQWADKAAASGLKFIVFNNIGAPIDQTTLPLVNKFLARLGLRHGNGYIRETSGSTLVRLNKKMIGFERPLFTVLPPYNIFEKATSDLQEDLVLRSPPHAGNKKAVLVGHGPGGGFVHAGYATVYEPVSERELWLLNPFAFFRAALGNERFPIPDTTTMSGRRLYFSHVDGDGWLNVSYIERYLASNTLSSEVMLKELIAPYPDLPVTVALVTGDLDEKIGGDAQAGETARALFALPQVEVGSHTHTHPFNWEFYENYDRARELEIVEQQSRSINSKKDDRDLIGSLSKIVTRSASSRERNIKYIAGSDNAPRAYMRQPYDLIKDIYTSLKIVERYAPPGKKAKLLQWSGNTRPFERAIKATRLAGVGNLNGGDPRFDMEFPSHAYLSPLSRMAGSERQIYAAASNENTYTNDWTGPYYGFMALSDTLARTESPRRLKPFNVYYHTYSAERAASLKAVKKHLDAARSGPYTPIPASLFAAIVNGFFNADIHKTGPNSWTIKNRGQLQTLRFDEAQKLELDGSKSIGILGSRRHAGALYIALDADIGQPQIVLRRKDKKTRPETRPALNQSRWQIRGLKQSRDHCQTSFTAQGFGTGEMVWNNVPPGNYIVKAKQGRKVLWHKIARIGADRILKLAVPLPAFKPLEVSFACRQKTSSDMVPKRSGL